ncbi:MAG: threonine synthase, partial [Burkholderiales bacterium]
QEIPIIALETALPIKFAATVEEAVGFEPPMTDAQKAMMKLPQQVTTMGLDVNRVKAMIAASL